MDFVTLVGGGVWGEPGLTSVLRTAHLIGRPPSQPGGEANRHHGRRRPESCLAHSHDLT